MAESVYWHEPTMRNDGALPSVLAIGDSWFWYPLPGGSLATALARLVAARQHTILAFGNNGAEAFDYVGGVYADAVERALDRYGAGCSAVFVSGGGNDFAGFNDLRPLLRVDCGACTTAAACFDDGTQPSAAEALFARVARYYADLIDRILWSVPAAATIFVHSYDYALPSGQAVIGSSAWLQPALVAAGVPPALRAGCVAHLIDRFSAQLADIEAGYGGRVVFVDSRGALRPADWANELHPTGAGFRRIAQQRWRPALAAAGLA